MLCLWPRSPRQFSGPEPRHGLIPDDIFFAGIAEINQKLTKKEFSAVELARAFCDRLETIGPRYNALALLLRKDVLHEAKEVDGDIKRERLRGPLQGIPFGAKDLLALPNIPPLGARNLTRIRFSIIRPRR